MKALAVAMRFFFLIIIMPNALHVADAFGFTSPFESALISHNSPFEATNTELTGVREKRAIRGSWNYWYSSSYSGSLVASVPPDSYLRTWITSEHNRYRRMTPATNMRMMYWSEELAASAQRHADTCDFRHSRFRVNIGENIWAAPYHNYSDAIWRWYNEVNNPWCGCNNGYKHCCGHYIQLVWAKTNLVGCGYAQSPAFNWAYNDNQKCKDCPSDQPACHEGLCYMPLSYNTGRYQWNNTRNSASDDSSIDRNTIEIRRK